MLSLTLKICFFYCRENLENFLETKEMAGMDFNGGWANPARILINFYIGLFALAVPIFYGLIFWFRRVHAVTNLGYLILLLLRKYIRVIKIIKQEIFHF